MIKYLVFFILLTIIGIFYDKYKKKIIREKMVDEYDLVKKYLLNEDALSSNTPIIWIHLDYNINSRKWLNFGSRNTRALNQPYKHITIQSIINKSKGKFNVCLVDDDSLIKLIPGWKVDINKISDPLKGHFRSMGMIKLLYYYGGMTLPSSYLALKDLDNLYNAALQNSTAFIFETVNRNMTSSIDNTKVLYYPNHKIMGCVRESPVIKELMLYLERLNTRDFTEEQDFVGHIDRWCYKNTLEKDVTKKMNLVDGKLIGIKTKNNEPLYLDNLLESSYIEFDSNLQGIYIPDDELLKRTKYEWFARISPKEIYESNIILGKYMLLSNE
jgi:hypothetical protein